MDTLLLDFITKNPKSLFVLKSFKTKHTLRDLTKSYINFMLYHW